MAVLDGDALDALDAGPPAPLARFPRSRPMHYTSGTTGQAEGGVVRTVGRRHRGGRLRRRGRSVGLRARRRPPGVLPDVPLGVGALRRRHPPPGRHLRDPRPLRRRYGRRRRWPVPTDRCRPPPSWPPPPWPGCWPFPTPQPTGVVPCASWSMPARRARRPSSGPPSSVLGPDVLWEFYGSTEGQFTVCPPAEWSSPAGHGGPGPARPEPVGRRRRGGLVPAAGVRPVRLLAGRGQDGGGLEGRRPSRWATSGASTTRATSTSTAAGTTWSSRGGVNVYPAEVEAALADVPGVAEVAVFGVPDERWGQRVCAAVVRGPRCRRRRRLAACAGHASTHLAGYKRPKQYEVVEALPRTATGKVRRLALPEVLDCPERPARQGRGGERATGRWAILGPCTPSTRVPPSPPSTRPPASCSSPSSPWTPPPSRRDWPPRQPAPRPGRRAPSSERSRLLVTAAELLEGEVPDIAQTVTIEMGKPFAQAKGEVAKCAHGFRWFAEHAEAMLADQEVLVDASLGLVTYQPLGRGAGHHAVELPALAGGPVPRPGRHGRQRGPAQARAERASHRPAPGGPVPAGRRPRRRAPDPAHRHRPGPGGHQPTPGWPPSPSPAAWAPAGPWPPRPGRWGRRWCSSSGGATPSSSCPSADLDRAVPVAVQARVQNAGQSCIAAKRFIVHQDVAEEFTERFVEAMDALSVGDPFDPATEVGPLINAAAVDGIEAQVEDARAKGATILCGGERVVGPAGPGPSRLLLPPDGHHRHRPGHAGGHRGGLRPGGAPLRRRPTPTRPWPWPTTPSSAWARACGPTTPTSSSGS